MSDPVLLERKFAELLERRLKEFKMQLGPMKRAPKRWPRKGGSGGGLDTTYAMVINTAERATWTGDFGDSTLSICGRVLGTCALLSHPEACFNMPVLEEGQTIDDYTLNLENPYDEVPLTTGRLIKVASTDGSTIPTGPYTQEQEDRPWVVGEYVRITDYLRELNGFEPEKVLWTPDGGDIEWAGEEC